MKAKTLAEYREVLYSSDDIDKRKVDLSKYDIEKIHVFVDGLCPDCFSNDSIKNGIDLSPRGNKQKWICKKCKRHFRTGI